MYIFDMIEKHPDLRFGQILSVLEVTERDEELNWKNEYYLEPEELLKRVEIAAEKLLKENL
jgi:hypothetical protein